MRIGQKNDEIELYRNDTLSMSIQKKKKSEIN